MQKIVRIGFDEQSKAVTASVKIEYIAEAGDTGIDHRVALMETEQLMQEALDWARQQTLRKLR